MTSMTDFDRVVASWLETDGPADIRSEVVDAALASAERVVQRRGLRAAWTGPSRWPTRRGPISFTALPPTVRVAIALALALALLAGSIYVGVQLIRTKQPIQTYTGVLVASGPLTSAPMVATAVELGDGRVLLAGAGLSQSKNGSLLWDPASGRFTDTGPMMKSRPNPVGLLLLDGRVLILGGDPAGTTEIYDAATGTFSPGGTMQLPRVGFSVAGLSDGRVLVAGGHASGASLRSAEIYDAATGAFSVTGPMAAARAGHAMTRLPDGRILVSGGAAGDAVFTGLAEAELFDPRTGMFLQTGDMNEPRSSIASVLVGDGRVFVAGGCDEDVELDPVGRSHGFAPAPAEFFDPRSGTFVRGATVPHCVGTLTALPNGEVLITGWWYETSSTIPGEVEQQTWSGLFDPVNRGMRIIAPPAGGRYMAVVGLRDGRVLQVGEDVRDAGRPDAPSFTAEVLH